MKKFRMAVLAHALILLLGSLSVAAEPLYITEGIHWCESVFPWEGGIFISNFTHFRSSEPVPTESKGFVTYAKEGRMENYIPPDGRLRNPTGTYICGRAFFVCDGPDLKIFDREHPDAMPRVIAFSRNDVVNALTADSRYLYISLTMRGKIYRLDVSPEKVMTAYPEPWLDVPGPNGLTMNGKTMYIASIPTDFRSFTEQNVIYRVPDVTAAHPEVEKLNVPPGLYDGVALSDSGKTLYFSDWDTASVSAMNLETSQIRTVYSEKGIGPSDIAQAGGKLYVPDLPNSRLIVIDLSGDQ